MPAIGFYVGPLSQPRRAPGKEGQASPCTARPSEPEQIQCVLTRRRGMATKARLEEDYDNILINYS